MQSLDDLRPLTCGDDTPIREVLARINASEGRFQLVVDGAGGLAGTVTDGDVRRGLLRGVGLDDPVAACMFTRPIVAREHGTDHRALMARVDKSAPFLPVLDGSGRLVRVLVDAPRDTRLDTVLIMAGGRGSRLGERTLSMPKPLIEVGGKPMLARILEGLEQAGSRQVFISVHYLAEQVTRFVAEFPTSLQIRLLHEEHPLGTGGALGLLPRDGIDSVLVLNGDVMTKVDYGKLLAFHGRHGFDGTIAVARHAVEIPYGVVRLRDDGLLDRIEEKPTWSYFAAAGIYYLSSEFLALAPPDTPVDMPEILRLGREAGLRIGVFPVHEYWMDVGRPSDLDAADRAMAAEA